MMQVNGSTESFNIWTSYTRSSSDIKNALNDLSSGTISTADSPASIGISERLRAEAYGSSMAIQNTETAISMSQTQDGWLQEVSDQLSRMKELAIESNGIMSSTDTANVNSEFKAMQSEIARITSGDSAAAQFNGVPLFQGGSEEIQVGADEDQQIEVELADLQDSNSETIGTVTTYTYNDSNEVVDTQQLDVSLEAVLNIDVNSEGAIGQIDAAIDYVSNVRAEIGAQQVRLESTREGQLTYEANTRETESKIRDVDMARASSEMAMAQVQNFAANAMLVQANNLSANTILTLLS